MRAVAADDPAWEPESEAVTLLDSEEMTYLPQDLPGPKNPVPEWKVHVLLRGVTRIRTEDARRIGYAVLPYNPDLVHILSATAWTIGAKSQKATVYRRSDFSDTVAVYNTFYWDFRRVLQLITVDKAGPGDALAWEFEFESKTPFPEYGWSARGQNPLLYGVCTVVPAPGDTLDYVTTRPDLLTPQPGDRPGSLRWQVVRLAALPRNLPGDFFPNPVGVFFRPKSSTGGTPPATWEQTSRQVAREMESKVDTTGADVTAEVTREEAGQSGRWNRIRALCRFVQESITYLQITEEHDGLAGIRPHSPSTVLRNRFGDCKDKATLLVSDLRSIGETARVLLVNHGGPLVIRKDWPSPNFNHAIVMIKADGSEPASWPKISTAEGPWILFDPTDRDTPLGVLPPGDGGGWGLVVAESAGELVRLPVDTPETNGLTLKVHLTLGKDDVATAHVTEDYRGTWAATNYGRRRAGTSEQYREFLDAAVHRANPLSHDLHWKDEWDAENARYRVTLDYVIPAFGHAMPNGMLRIDPDVLASSYRPGAWTKEADGTVFFACDSVEEEVDLELPDSYAVEELPENMKRSGSSFGGQVTFLAQGAHIVITTNLVRRPGFYNRAQYNELRAFYREFREAQRGSVLLRPSAPKGAS
jgi:transglutaminase-like putative cysteine protease